jgi:leader peptidase (prepilin peptidase) / N-methyltransferase
VTAAVPGGLPAVVAWPLAIALAATLGSFLNVCISRLPHGGSVLTPRRSYCPRCRSAIRAYDNIPLVSFALLGGRCRDCRAPISWRYPLVEALAVAAGILVLWQLGPTWDGLRAFILTLALIAVTFTDFEERIIPDRITLPGIAVGLALQLYPSPGSGLLDGLLGLLVAGGLFYAIAWLSPKVFGREGMGGGDIKLAAMMGAFLGLKLVLVALYVGVLVGGVLAVLGLVLGLARLRQQIAFGPFLALGGVVAALWGRAILAWYLG